MNALIRFSFLAVGCVAVGIVFAALVGTDGRAWAGSAATTGGTPVFVHAVLEVRVNACGVSPRRIRVVRRTMVLVTVAASRERLWRSGHTAGGRADDAL